MIDSGCGSLTIRDHIGTGENNHLTLHGIDLVGLANEYETPLFVFDERSLVENYEAFRQSFENVYPKVMVCYSVKTNNNLAICNILSQKGACAAVSSEQDLHVTLKAGFPVERVIYDGPFKPRQALEKALDKKLLLINVESFSELERLNSIAKQKGIEQAIGLRVNPFRAPGFFKSLHLNSLIEAGYCYPSSRFGFSPAEIHQAFDQLKNLKNLRLESLMLHPYHKAMSVLLPLLKEATEKFGFEIKYLNVGGGFNPGVTGSSSEYLLIMDSLKRRLGLKSSLDKKRKSSDIGSIAKSLVQSLRQNLGGLPEPTLISEPGTFIVGPSGMLLLRVDHTKRSGGYKWISVDAGTNILPLIYERRKILVANNATASNQELVNVVGPLLYPKDFVAIKVQLPKVKQDDLLAVFDCGAYSLSSSTQFLYPRPATALIDLKGRVKIIRERETYEDVVRKDRLP